MNFKLPRTAGLTIAVLHVIEMFIGTATQIYTAREIGKSETKSEIYIYFLTFRMNFLIFILYFIVAKGRECARTINSIKWSMIPHISLLFFFGKLLFNYIVRNRSKAKEA